MLTDNQRIERYRKGLKLAWERWGRAVAADRPDWIAYNQRRITKYEKLLSEPLRPMRKPIGSSPIDEIISDVLHRPR